RYTSYPTVPYWDNTVDVEQWKQKAHTSFIESNKKDGISIYIHLPYCESLCTYCACNTRITVNHQVEAPYIAALIKEWNLYLNVLKDKPRIKEIHLGGGTPTFFSAVHLKKLIKTILAASEVCADAEFSFEAHPDNTTTEHLQTLFNLGFKRVSFGIQDFDLKVQKAIHRFQSFEQVKKIVDEARAIGYNSINFDLIYGLPFQTLNSVIDNINQVNLLRPDRIAFYSYAHVPWIKPGQRSFTEKDLPLDAEKRELYETGKQMFLDSGYIEVGMDHFALHEEGLSQALNQGKLHRNFMGYTHNYTKLLIGLGVSSISDSWAAFSQNVKTVEEYLDLVNKGMLPVFKNHFLNEEDLLLRQHILNIMCTYQTKWSEEQRDVLSESLSKLKNLEQDGLVQINNLSINVTTKGKPFLRNICMCFDKRYWNKTTEKKVFSSSI
ncbi:MAG TPA: oxygen-independent coproporphyrinogen III oxidase, partial [Bacteroidia bacterium]|nr:oxygen-independent coproporphyrinogen III oxidase [Bacteroidia bacterium]